MTSTFKIRALESFLTILYEISKEADEVKRNKSNFDRQINSIKKQIPLKQEHFNGYL
jgi:hypothetical protein